MGKTIIFVPGFKGSTLVDKTGQCVWPNFWRAQWHHQESLYLDLPMLNLVNPKQYQAKSIIDAVNVLPGLYRYSIYGRWLDFLNQALDESTRVFYYPYDWRQDLSVISQRLAHDVIKIHQDRNDEIIFVCHSMGGLIVSDVLRQLQLAAVRQVFFVSTPFEGSLKAALYLIYGSTLGCNKTLLSAKAMATFPSVYTLLPHDQVELLSTELWEKYALGFLMQDHGALGVVCFKQMLMLRESFYKRLESLAEYPYATEFVFINSTDYTTPTSISFGRKISIEYGPGDGSVSSRSLAIPTYFKSLRTTQYSISKRHSLSFRDKELFKLIFA